MHQIVDDDDWLSSELQTIFKETKQSNTRFELKRALVRFEKRLSMNSSRDYVSPKLILSNDNESKAWISFGKISQGELLLAEKPLCWVLPKIRDPTREYSFILWKKLIQKCKDDKKLLKNLKMLFPRTQTDIKRIRQESENYQIPIKEIKDYFESNIELASQIRINEALRIYLVVKYNQMSVNMLPELWKNPFKWSERFSINSLYLKSSYFDHSCSPNVARFYIGTVAIFKALRPIKHNEILSICYIENEYIQDPLWVRNSELNFFCRCKLCQKEGGFTLHEQTSKVSEINKTSKKLNKRCSLLSRKYICMLQGLALEERISIIEDVLKESFLQNDQTIISKVPRLVGLDASKLIGFLIHDYIIIKNYEKAQFWLNIMYKTNRIKDENNIPILILLGMISKDIEIQKKYFQRAVKISKTVFGSHIKFFMKRYWLDIKYFGNILYENTRKKVSYLRHISLLIRHIFSKK
ncbi:SET domain-containing protein [Cryptosporidium ubiquitum]|uniref:SET domain-containing protein n=1 Tax=Cryptosporidium ubiquitum TaxID=857276 RepID=A0A1J4MFL3_9CRYT|nr:SET domain-containing protein [Cryptosporidium ubiquitum]OII72993.1 SET domain-containing protein [Cryptosporidium ubiquitum]